MKILLCSIGSRGDIQPFLILGDYFAQKGHEVIVASAKMYQSLAANYKVKYEYFEGDYASLIDDEEMKKMVGKNPLTIGKNLKEKVYPIIENSLDTFYELSQWADVILYHPKTLIDSFGQPIQNKLIKAYVVPAFSPTAAFPNPILPFPNLASFLNRLTYKMTNAMMSSVKTPIVNFRKKHQLPKTPLFLETSTIYGISPNFLERPSDYPENHHFTGFWLQKTEQATLSDAVQNFVTDSKPVVLITFGSMPYKSKIDINDYIKALLDRFDIKILIVKAWGLKEAKIEAHKSVLAIDRAPFDLLFPLVNAAVHHGGAGTTATALQAGIPQMICPVLYPFGDQYFWGKQVEKQGLGVAPVPLSKLTINQLVKGVGELISGAYAGKAKKFGGKIREENGLKKALEIVES